MQNRRSFLTSVSMLAAGAFIPTSAFNFGNSGKKLRIVLVGTGIRGTSFWGRRLVEDYSDILEFVGICDINPGRLAFAKEYMKVSCPTFTNYDQMLDQTHPDLIIVTTKDSTHHEFIIKGLDKGIDVLTEKPLTTDERKCQEILEAERRSRKNLLVGFNYRWSPYMTKIKELLVAESIGKITSVDFHWYLNTYHGASYFRRWHGETQNSGSLWVHKATHHFDLLNWWLDSDPYEVFAYGALDHYGSKGKFRGENCRSCNYQKDCKFYFDINKDEHLTKLYVNHEKHDGYIWDSCLFRHEINIHDKMSAQIKYANDVTVNYSLTTYSPFEGWMIAFNGMEGRLEAWQDIPWMEQVEISQAELHAAEMNKSGKEVDIKPIIMHKNWNKFESIPVSYDRGGHGGGDERLHHKIFRNPEAPDPLRHAAGSRDGAMSILIGIAARKSIESGRLVRIAELTDLEPRAKRL
ncbi:MAG: Gfo/Idh/MocA family oxidoreductase [Microscillaceae bacterium]|nr:Gfo/Idh/MocA family oxidoreductase [Microscillaceae bacterium]